jgi:hypothetical protein
VTAIIIDLCAVRAARSRPAPEAFPTVTMAQLRQEARVRELDEITQAVLAILGSQSYDITGDNK